MAPSQTERLINPVLIGILLFVVIDAFPPRSGLQGEYLVLRTPVLPFLLELLNDFGVGCGDIVLFKRIFSQSVKLAWFAHAKTHEFPFVGNNCARSLMLEKEVSLGQGLPFERGASPRSFPCVSIKTTKEASAPKWQPQRISSHSRVEPNRFFLVAEVVRLWTSSRCSGTRNSFRLARLVAASFRVHAVA